MKIAIQSHLPTCWVIYIYAAQLLMHCFNYCPGARARYLRALYRWPLSSAFARIYCSFTQPLSLSLILVYYIDSTPIPWFTVIVCYSIYIWGFIVPIKIFLFYWSARNGSACARGYINGDTPSTYYFHLRKQWIYAFSIITKNIFIFSICLYITYSVHLYRYSRLVTIAYISIIYGRADMGHLVQIIITHTGACARQRENYTRLCVARKRETRREREHYACSTFSRGRFVVVCLVFAYMYYKLSDTRENSRLSLSSASATPPHAIYYIY